MLLASSSNVFDSTTNTLHDEVPVEAQMHIRLKTVTLKNALQVPHDLRSTICPASHTLTPFPQCQIQIYPLVLPILLALLPSQLVLLLIQSGKLSFPLRPP